ncbi:carboxypeptidase inhibitor SmCI-like [Argiope bruennichi]|uniref:carboxypeptidase inhibitor SmCI-like n=1 Tax=Argiope bruennichi TaxID=94029 RepID=UPI002494D64F|nr:carboxypeptidase inhibitor SmCI-like [Argiope bruennichi]
MKVLIVLLLVAAAVESITAQSPSDCNLPKETGPCFGYFPRYYYDPKTNTCKKFIYGGCGGNRNNFWTQEECQDKCRVICEENAQYESCGTLCPLTCENYENPPQACAAVCVQGCQCKKGFVRTENGGCVKPEECPGTGNPTLRDCDKLPETGPCKAYVPRYYYDRFTDTCSLFIYGGCGGNKNNFKTEEECYQKCRVQCEENAHYEDCGTACPLTCENYNNPPEFCPAICLSGCQCDEGFVQTESGRCVKPEDCPVKCNGITIQTSTGEEISTPIAQSCNKNVETVKIVDEPYAYTNMTELENSDRNDNNGNESVNDPGL